MNADVTCWIEFDNPDDESLPVLKCVCGKKFEPWAQTISIYQKFAEPMPCCGRRIFFRQDVRVYEVQKTPDDFL